MFRMFLFVNIFSGLECVDQSFACMLPIYGWLNMNPQRASVVRGHATNIATQLFNQLSHPSFYQLGHPSPNQLSHTQSTNLATHLSNQLSHPSL